MDENKHPNQSQSSKENQKGTQASTPPTAPVVRSRRIFAKRWVYPALYLGAAALIIGLMYIKSQSGTSPVTSTNVDDNNSMSTTNAAETLKWPIAAGVSTKVSLGFFNDHGNAQDQAAALVSYNDGYYAHVGYDIKATSGNAFSVTAASSGKVTKVSSDPVYGKTVEVSNNGYVVRYQSLGDIQVKQGDTISQGQVLGTSGTCEFEKSQGNHLYFEVDKNGVPVDPGSLLPKQ